MAIIGITLDRQNPEFTIDDFVLWMPQYANFVKTDEGQKYFNKVYKLLTTRSSTAFSEATGNLR